MKDRDMPDFAYKPLRLKTLSVICEDIVQKVGEIKISIMPFEELGSISIGDLNKIKIEFEQVSEPIFKPVFLNDKIINCGFIKFIVKNIHIPPFIPNVVSDIIRNVFFKGAESEIIAIPVQGILEVCGVKESDEVEEFSEVEGITTCFVLESEQLLNTFVLSVLLVIKVAIKVRIIVSRYKLLTAETSEIEDVMDFECE